MNLLARILSHGFALAVVVLLGIALMYKGDLFPEWKLPEFLVVENEIQGGAGPAADIADSAADTTEQEEAAAVVDTVEDTSVSDTAEDASASDTAVSASPASPAETPAADVEQQALTQDATPPEDVMEEEAADVAQDVAEPDVENETPEDATEQGQAEPVVADADRVVETETAAAASEDAQDNIAGEDNTDQAETAAASSVTDMAGNAGTSPAESPAEDMDVPATAQTEVPQPVPSMPPPPPAPSADTAAVSGSYELLAAAREAYWLRDYEQAEANYQQLIQLEPDNPDGYGELGNMYFAQGQWQPAAAAYYEAGVRLLNSGMVVQARQMLEVIRGLNGEQADALEQQINQAQQDAPSTGQ